MKLLFTPAEETRIRRDFDAAVNLSADALAAWLRTPESQKVGYVRPGERESVGRQSGRRIIHILESDPTTLTASDYAHMRKVVGFIRRHRAQRPWGDVTHTRWRWSLMNWGHDPLL